MNVVLLVVDSLRADAIAPVAQPESMRPFWARLRQETVAFERAYATECWTLPTHLSMFTGLLPSAHGAHFQHLGYDGRAPTIAEHLSAAGFHTEVVTRNSIFDGSLPGVTRGFGQNTLVLSQHSSGLNPLSLILALSKPRFRRQIAQSGFFHQSQRDSLRFLTTFARATVPADREALAHVVARMAACRQRQQPYFLFCNLYDVHAPYPPSPDSIFRPPWSLRGIDDLIRMPVVMPKLGGHQYLRPGFRMSARSQAMLRARYQDAVTLMDTTLDTFYRDALGAGLLDDTLLIVTSDHGEAFGEHGLYLHDASVYQTHLHVPLFVRHPALPPAVVDNVVSTRDLFGLLRGVALGAGWQGTILDPTYRAAHPIALAEHFHYQGVPDALPMYRQNLVTAITAEDKLIVRPEATESYDLTRDSAEQQPEAESIEHFAARCRRLGIGASAADAAVDHLRAWRLHPRGGIQAAVSAPPDLSPGSEPAA